jgi:hypothetical protein
MGRVKNNCIEHGYTHEQLETYVHLAVLEI